MPATAKVEKEGNKKISFSEMTPPSFWLSLFRCGSAGEESACSVGDLGLIPVLGRSPGEGKGYPLQYSDLENSMDCIVHRVKSRTQPSDFHFTDDCSVNIQSETHPCLYTTSVQKLLKKTVKWGHCLNYFTDLLLEIFT